MSERLRGKPLQPFNNSGTDKAPVRCRDPQLGKNSLAQPRLAIRCLIIDQPSAAL
jgi:hypothetical protein